MNGDPKISILSSEIQKILEKDIRGLCGIDPYKCNESTNNHWGGEWNNEYNEKKDYFTNILQSYKSSAAASSSSSSAAAQPQQQYFITSIVYMVNDNEIYSYTPNDGKWYIWNNKNWLELQPNEKLTQYVSNNFKKYTQHYSNGTYQVFNREQPQPAAMADDTIGALSQPQKRTHENGTTTEERGSKLQRTQQTQDTGTARSVIPLTVLPQRPVQDDEKTQQTIGVTPTLSSTMFNTLPQLSSEQQRPVQDDRTPSSPTLDHLLGQWGWGTDGSQEQESNFGESSITPFQ